MRCNSTQFVPDNAAAKKLLACACTFMLIFLATAPTLAARTRKSSAPPQVQQIDPPNWWSGLPNPMLLLRGSNLANAEISSSVHGISVRRTTVSANGHWAFVWLDIASAPPQKLNLVVHTPAGTLHLPYELSQRHLPTDGFQGFSPADVLYLAIPDRFADGDPANDQLPQMKGTFDPASPNAYHGGDLLGLTQHLDYIQQLGATTLWITPIYAQNPTSAADYSGYAPTDLYRVNPHLGTLPDYQNLAQSIHDHGMKLVLDVVLNHVGPKSPWVLDPPAPDWFHGTPAQHLEAAENFTAITDPHAPPGEYQSTVNGWLGDTLPDLNQSNPLVRQYLLQNVLWWIESGTLDGLRLDTFPNVDRAFWQDFHATLHALYPHLTTVGEILHPDPTVVSFFAGGAKHSGIDTGLTTAFDFPGSFALRATLTGNDPMTRLTDVERQDWLYPHPDRLVTFFGNHDARRFLSMPDATAADLRLAFGLLTTTRGLPQIYYGDEVALNAANNSGNRQNFPGGFPNNNSGDSNNAFTAAGRTAPQEAMHAWVTGLLQLRAQHAVLQNGLQQSLFADDTGFVFARFQAPPAGRPAAAVAQGEIMLVLLNKSDAPRTFHLDFSHTSLQGLPSFDPAWNTKQPITIHDDACDVTVSAHDIIVLKSQR